MQQVGAGVSVPAGSYRHGEGAGEDDSGFELEVSEQTRSCTCTQVTDTETHRLHGDTLARGRVRAQTPLCAPRGASSSAPASTAVPRSWLPITHSRGGARAPWRRDRTQDQAGKRRIRLDYTWCWKQEGPADRHRSQTQGSRGPQVRHAEQPNEQ